MAQLDKADIRALDNARSRFSQLSYTLNSFTNNFQRSEQLIPWANQQTQFAILSSNLESLSKTLSQHFPDLPTQQQIAQTQSYNRPTNNNPANQPTLTQDVLIAYPNTLFPAREHETLIHALLRKKLQPPVQDWVNEGREAGLAAVPSTNPDEVGWLTDADTSKLWNSAVELIRELGDERDWDDAYTKEEREDGIENLVTGLRPEMMEIGSLDEKGKRKIGGAGVPTEKIEGGLKEEQMFRFLSTGMLPQVPGSVQSYPGGR